MPDQLRHDERYGRLSDHPLAAPHHGWQSAPSMPMDKTFDPAAIEAKCAHEWSIRGLFRPARPDAPPFTFFNPPPNFPFPLHILPPLVFSFPFLPFLFLLLPSHFPLFFFFL